MIFTSASATPIWVLAVSVLNVLFLCAMSALVLYAMWKAYKWLRKWKP
jgi:hypothetical protein